MPFQSEPIHYQALKTSCQYRPRKSPQCVRSCMRKTCQHVWQTYLGYRQTPGAQEGSRPHSSTTVTLDFRRHSSTKHPTAQYRGTPLISPCTERGSSVLGAAWKIPYPDPAPNAWWNGAYAHWYNNSGERWVLLNRIRPDLPQETRRLPLWPKSSVSCLWILRNFCPGFTLAKAETSRADSSMNMLGIKKFRTTPTNPKTVAPPRWSSARVLQQNTPQHVGKTGLL